MLPPEVQGQVAINVDAVPGDSTKGNYFVMQPIEGPALDSDELETVNREWERFRGQSFETVEIEVPEEPQIEDTGQGEMKVESSKPKEGTHTAQPPLKPEEDLFGEF